MNYLLYFKKGSTELAKLKEIKAINYTLVQWSHYINFKGQTTQCRRCQLPGHGTRHCNLPPKCANCGESHLTDSCDKKKAAQTEAKSKAPTATSSAVDRPIKISKFTWKCANCQGPLSASDPRCPAKLEYANLRRRLATKNRQRPMCRHIEADFPALTQMVPPPPPQRGRQSYSSAVQGQGKSQLNENNFLNGNSFAFGNRNQNVKPLNSELFSLEEINSLTQEMLAGLSAAKNCFDQFAVITNLAAKYLYGPK